MSFNDQERAEAPEALGGNPSDAAKPADATNGRIRDGWLPATFVVAAVVVMACWIYLLTWLLSIFLIWLLSKFVIWLIS
jgi:hypothetical protein